MTRINPDDLCTSTTVVLASADDTPRQPEWLVETVLVLQLLRDRGWLAALHDMPPTPRGRAGTYIDVDYALVLIAAAIHPPAALHKIVSSLAPHASLLAGCWGRQHLPSASALSRWLAAQTPEQVHAWRQLHHRLLLSFGLPAPTCGALTLRHGQDAVLFDFDGTRAAVRRRALPRDTTRPAPRLRSAAACAPGYTSRKRGEVMRTRFTLDQAHSREWLGTWSAPGNGTVHDAFDAALDVTTSYLAARSFDPHVGVIRADGQLGYAHYAWSCHQRGLGWLVRCCDRGLFLRRDTQRRLRQSVPVEFTQTDSGLQRLVHDLGQVDWSVGRDRTRRVSSRLVISSRATCRTEGSPNIGILHQRRVYEMFATSLPVEAATAVDVIDLYFNRGGFETTLAHEDREQGTDRWATWQPDGQEIWQLINQMVWNLRLRLGHELGGGQEVRTMLWSEAIESSMPAPEPCEPATDRVVINACAPSRCEPSLARLETMDASTPKAVVWQPAKAMGRASGRLGAEQFVLSTDGEQVRCPAGVEMRRSSERREGATVRRVFKAPDQACQGCVQRDACLGHGHHSDNGRQVSFVAKAPPAVLVEEDEGDGCARQANASGPYAMIWRDQESSALRRAWTEATRRPAVQQSESPMPSTSAPAPPPWTRDQRAHRRQTWHQRRAHNARGAHSPAPHLLILGLPAAISHFLSISST